MRRADIRDINKDLGLEPRTARERLALGIDRFVERNARRLGCTILGGAAVGAGLLAAHFVGSVQPSVEDLARQYAVRPGAQGTWYTGSDLDESIRAELPGTVDEKQGDLARTTREVNAYRRDFLRRNPEIEGILEGQARGEAAPRTIAVEYVELDRQPGFGS